MDIGGNTYFSIKGGFMRIIIVGAGPSGLVCALKSKNDHNEVIILEKEKEVGKKLLVTG